MTKAALIAERDHLDAICAHLEQKVARLEVVLADFMSMARDMVKYNAPDCVIRMHFETMLKQYEKESE